jgi:protein tyrosine/serine phosphatase
VPNFQAVNEHVLRGGQPSEEGFRNLAARGVKTIVDLRKRDGRSKSEEKLVNSLGMRYVNIAMKGMHTPSDEQIRRALMVLKDDSAAPVFVHCRRGADRTGAVVACYRVQHDNWDNPKALHEARGYGMSWYQFQIKRYVLSYKAQGESGAVADAADSRSALEVAK